MILFSFLSCVNLYLQKMLNVFIVYMLVTHAILTRWGRNIIIFLFTYATISSGRDTPVALGAHHVIYSITASEYMVLVCCSIHMFYIHISKFYILKSRYLLIGYLIETAIWRNVIMKLKVLEDYYHYIYLFCYV